MVSMMMDTTPNFGRWGVVTNAFLKGIPWRALVLTTAGGGVVGLVMQGSFLQQLVALGLVVWILGPAALFLVVAGLMMMRRQEEVRGWLVKLSVLWVFAFLTVAVSMTVGDCVNRYQVHQTRRYVEKALPVLDAFHEKEGRFPETLDEAGLDAPPKLLRENGAYSGVTHTFRFEYWDPAELMGGWEMIGDDREWVKFE